VILTLENYVKLRADLETVIRVKDGSFRVEAATITDRQTRAPKQVRKAVVDVIEENSLPVSKTFSTLAEKLAAQLRTMHDNGDLYRYRIGLTWHPAGYATEYSIRLL